MARMPIPRRLLAFSLLLFSGLLCAQPPQLMLALPWEIGADPTGWWMSEKYDGVRGYWDGQHMFSREGTPIILPELLKKELPPFPLDGELWAGRGQFEKTLSTVRRREPDERWQAIRYKVFDLPASTAAFPDRLRRLALWLQSHPSRWIEVIEQHRCDGTMHLDAFLAQIEEQGGEGVVLRADASLYKAGRSANMRKLKSFSDSEAKVIGHKPGKGKYEGMLGSLLVELENGTRFSVGSGLRDAERLNPPPIGSLITFKYYGWTARGKPRFPVYWRRYRPLDGRE